CFRVPGAYGRRQIRVQLYGALALRGTAVVLRRQAAQGAVEGLEGHGVDVVARELRQVVVVVADGLYLLRAGAAPDGGHEPGQLRVRRAAPAQAGQARALALYERAHVHEVVQQRLVHLRGAVFHDDRKGLRRRLVQEVGDEGALTRHDAHEALALQLQ